MSERTFFTLRYALPGYIFLLSVILVNWESLFSVRALSPVFGALFAFLYLLSGSAIGFLVSQLWYVYFNWRLFGKYYYHDKINTILKKLTPLESFDKHALQVFSDYIQRLSTSKGMLTYSQRRWDLIHIFGSAIFAIPSGLTVGILYYLINKGFQFAILFNAWENHRLLILLIIIPTILIMVCLWKGFRWALKEHSMARLILIQEVLNEKKNENLLTELRRVFLEYFTAPENGSATESENAEKKQ